MVASDIHRFYFGVLTISCFCLSLERIEVTLIVVEAEEAVQCCVSWVHYLPAILFHKRCKLPHFFEFLVRNGFGIEEVVVYERVLKC